MRENRPAHMCTRPHLVQGAQLVGGQRAMRGGVLQPRHLGLELLRTARGDQRAQARPLDARGAHAPIRPNPQNGLITLSRPTERCRSCLAVRASTAMWDSTTCRTTWLSSAGSTTTSPCPSAAAAAVPSCTTAAAAAAAVSTTRRPCCSCTAADGGGDAAGALVGAGEALELGGARARASAAA